MKNLHINNLLPKRYNKIKLTLICCDISHFLNSNSVQFFVIVLVYVIALGFQTSRKKIEDPERHFGCRGCSREVGKKRLMLMRNNLEFIPQETFYSWSYKRHAKSYKFGFYLQKKSHAIMKSAS